MAFTFDTDKLCENSIIQWRLDKHWEALWPSCKQTDCKIYIPVWNSLKQYKWIQMDYQSARQLKQCVAKGKAPSRSGDAPLIHGLIRRCMRPMNVAMRTLGLRQLRLSVLCKCDTFLSCEVFTKHLFLVIIRVVDVWCCSNHLAPST